MRSLSASLQIVVPCMLGLSAAACSSSSNPQESPDASTPSLAEFCNDFMQANDVLLNRCIGGSASIWGEELPSKFSCASLEAAVAAGRITYHAPLAASCLAAFPALSCSDLFVGPTQCDGPLAGTVANGGACFADGDCGGSSYCSGVGFAQSSCQGKCTPLLAPGAACTQGEECAIGFTCGGDPTSMTCISDIHPLAASGQSCAILPPTKPSIQCGPGLSCNHESFLCAPTLAQGAACIPGEGVCETFTYCDQTTRKCVSDSSAGGVCGLSPMGELMECLPNFYCNLPTPQSATGTCAALGGGGDACTGNYQCVSGYCSAKTSAVTCSTPCTQE